MSLYVPAHFVPQERCAAMRIMHDYPFATLVTTVTAREEAPGSTKRGVAADTSITHLPLVHVPDCEPHGTLFGHFARANPHSAYAEAAESIAVFHGPHAYVSPSLYEDPAGSVPTWNYAVVHAHGTLDLATDPAQTRAILDTMIHRFEALRPNPWTLALDAARLDALVGAIIGFRLRIKRVEAKFKLSQNRSGEDRRRVAAALAQGDAESAATAAWMQGYGDVETAAR